MTTLSQGSTWAGAFAPAETFNVIMVIGNHATAERGDELSVQWATKLCARAGLRLGHCKFSLLCVAWLEEISRAQAAVADLVIVCPSCGSSAARLACSWFEQWRELKHHDDCAMLLLEEPARSGGRVTCLASTHGLGTDPTQPPFPIRQSVVGFNRLSATP